jgi:hypothetical protein
LNTIYLVDRSWKRRRRRRRRRRRIFAETRWTTR